MGDCVIVGVDDYEYVDLEFRAVRADLGKGDVAKK